MLRFAGRDSDDPRKLAKRSLPILARFGIQSKPKAFANFTLHRHVAHDRSAGRLRNRRPSAVLLSARRICSGDQRQDDRCCQPSTHRCYGVEELEGSSASCEATAAAACSGVQSQPLRPDSEIGPSSEGVCEGISCVGAASASETARAAPKAAPLSAAAHAKIRRQRQSQWVDMVPIIAHPSEEYVKAWILGPLLWTLVQTAAQAQPAAPLSVGSLRDQTGAAVSGALVRAFNSAGATLAETRTSDDGTFSLAAAAPATVSVECDYCVPVTMHPQPSEPLAIVVHRFVAVMQRAPSRDDLTALPYAHVESAMSLAPYVVLNDSSATPPGPVISDRGLSAGGGLVVDSGVPIYDVTANLSPFVSVPSRATQHVFLSDAASAFRYGDRADAGIASFDTQDQRRAALAVGGGDRILAAGSTAGSFSGNAFLSNNALESRQRLDADANISGLGDSLDATVFSERGSNAADSSSNLLSSFSALRVSLERTRAQRLYAQLILDHGSYGASFYGSNETTAYWSDVNLRAGVESMSGLPFFLEASFHRATSDWAALEPIAGSLTQGQVSAGIALRGRQSDLVAGVSAFDIAYAGGPSQSSYALNTSGASTSLVTPSLEYRWHPGRRWSLDSLAASTFRLPTFLERYGMPPVSDIVTFDRNELFQTTLEYTDLQRLRASLTAYRQRTNGLDTGTLAGNGASLAWALSTHFSIRSWFLRMTDTRVQSMPYVRIASTFPVAAVGSVWLTYENEGHLRADAILRRDLLDGNGFNHVDASLFFPVAPHAEVFIGSDVREQRRFLDVGMRFER